jgi:aldehyde:ferredoxin oxidoreductase
MIRDDFRIMVVNLTSGKGEIVSFAGRDRFVGGSGLAAALFEEHGDPRKKWDDPEQPLIFTIGPLTGYFPLMSKTVCAFKSPAHDQFAESHAGGRSALALRFADLDGLVIVGRASRPVCLSVGERHLEIKDVGFLSGRDVTSTGKQLRRMFPGAGHRSIFRIGPAGENGCSFACINVDTYRHFGRLGSGAVMGSKNLKGIAIQGDGSFPLPETKGYPKLYKEIHRRVTATDMMSKYHNLGTAANLAALDGRRSLPWRNLQATSDPAIERISGNRFADDALLRNAACAGCPVGCIHVGFVREKFRDENRYLYRQVAYDYEPIFSTGSMLGITNPFDVLTLMDLVEKEGLDVMSAGVALAWATEAFEKGVVSVDETVVPLRFGEPDGYKKAIHYLGSGTGEFYGLLSKGAAAAAAHYGGQDFACVLGQEMAGYATGEVFFVSQALGFRHSHLDTGGYSYDQTHEKLDLTDAVDYLVDDEKSRVFLTSMVSCLFAREVYKEELLSEALTALGYRYLAERKSELSGAIQALRWKVRCATGFDPQTVRIPKRFGEVVTWKGPVDQAFMERLRQAYGQRIVALAGDSRTLKHEIRNPKSDTK